MNAAEIMESVAQAIQQTRRPGIVGQMHARMFARAAVLATLDALREPTRAMLNESSQDAASCSIETCAKVNWRDMIDALKREVADDGFGQATNPN